MKYPFAHTRVYKIILKNLAASFVEHQRKLEPSKISLGRKNVIITTDEILRKVKNTLLFVQIISVMVT
jgi:hypothetical protein